MGTKCKNCEVAGGYLGLNPPFAAKCSDEHMLCWVCTECGGSGVTTELKTKLPDSFYQTLQIPISQSWDLHEFSRPALGVSVSYCLWQLKPESANRNHDEHFNEQAVVKEAVKKLYELWREIARERGV